MPVGDKQVRFGPFQLDAQCGQLRKKGIGLKLQGQPVQILELLLEKPGELVTREEIRQHLWSSDTFVDFDHSLNTAMQRLRQALGDEAETPHYIETIPKRGYRFIGEVERVEEKPEPSPAAGVADQTAVKIAATLVDAAASTSQRSSALRRWRIALISVTTLLICAVVGYVVTRPSPVPQIVGSRAITKTKFRKLSLPNLVTDGKSVYFQEIRPSGLATMQVGVSGGELTQVSVSASDVGSLRDVSNDGSQLLLSISDPKANRYDAWIQPLPTGPPRRIVKDARWPVWSTDGRSLFFTRKGTELYRANADGTEAERLAVFPEITDLAISPNGKHLRFSVQSGRALWEADVDGSNPHLVLWKPGGVSTGSWSPDGKFYFFRSWGGERFDLWVIPEKRSWWTGKTPRPTQLTFGPISFNRPTVSNDGKHVYAVGAEHHGELSVYDSKSGQFVPYLSGLSACYVDFSRDGQWIAYVSFPDGNLWRSRIDGRERMQLTASPFAVLNPRWSPDGKLIAFTDLSGGDRRRLGEVSHIYVASAEGGEPMLLVAGSPVVADPTWSPDGKAIAYSVFKRGDISYPFTPVDIRILDLETRKSTKVPGSESFFSPRWSPDGKYLVALVGWPASRLMIFSFASQMWEELASGTFISWPSWSKDSKYVFAEDSELIRIGVLNHKKDVIANVAGFRATAYFYWGPGWFGITPEGKPITTRDTSLEEIYEFDLEYK